VDPRRAEGIVLLAVLLLTLLLTVVSASLVLVSSSQSAVAWNVQAFQEARYAAGAAAERAVAEISEVADWTLLVDGSVRSTFADGAPLGRRWLADGRAIDLEEVVNQANCGQTRSCSQAELNAATTDRPWGANNPRWRLFAHGWLRDLLPPGAIDSAYYIIVLVGDDEAEMDGDPLRDGQPLTPGGGVIELRATALGPRNVSRSVELTIARDARSAARIVSWRALG
jgi:hypothetical protein